MNRLKKIALLTFTLLFSLSAWSQDFQLDGLRFQLSGGGATVLGRVAGATETDINIPASVNYEGVDYPVTEIADSAFFSNSLTSVTIPDSVTAIGYRAFAVNALTEVTIPNSVTTIEDLMLAINALTEVTIPNSVTTIGTGAFFANALTSVTIPDSVTTIESGAFADRQVEDENGGSTNTLELESVTFEGEYTEWMPDLESVSPFDGTGISPETFAFSGEINSKYNSRSLSTISVCPSASWDNVTFEIEVGVLQPLGVTQDPAACPFVDPLVLIDELSAFVADLNAKNGILNALDAKLGAVQGALSDLNENNDVAALNAMYAFCYNAQAQSGKQLETADADALIAKADAIIAAIDPDAALCSE